MLYNTLVHSANPICEVTPHGDRTRLPLLFQPSDSGCTLAYMNAPWSLSSKALLDHYQVDQHVGLSDAQVKETLEKYGKNGASVCSDFVSVYI